MKEKEIKEKIKEGWIRCIVVFELVGKPKEHIEKTIRLYIENIKKDTRIKIIQEEYAEVIEHEDGMFSTFVETEMIIESLDVLNWLCVNFMPASIEIIEPSNLTFEARNLTGWFNDILSKLHEVSNNYRMALAGNKNMTIALNALIKNTILTCLDIKDMSIEEIEKRSGIQKEQLKPFLEHFLKNKKIKLKKNLYSIR